MKNSKKKKVLVEQAVNAVDIAEEPDNTKELLEEIKQLLEKMLVILEKLPFGK